ncbi:hypothetical protein [Vulcanococcus sp. Clear-D1]|jgi:hypothetical protein|uniref:hypothetical protein n=1 Tax=Vulcanococcus sp. Clear-D1 TaxID=2766970 RepID=UPI001985F952|nr:hypothetical protein [Vulcanococcus sp. Clear-D1]MBD1192790.1 hypothetical protein [Vulcanococcus sp. Clear-D1]
MGIVPHPSHATSSIAASTATGADLMAMGLAASSPPGLDPVESYFECITACSIDDGECVTQCVEVLRETDG